MATGPGKRRDILVAIEQSAGGARTWGALLLGWILARNLLEGILERPHQLGFDWRGDVSFAMVFLHFPIFYLAVFLLVALWLHLLSGRPLPAVSRVVAVGFGLLLIAPPFDALLSGGRGYDLRYTLGFGSSLRHFWTPGDGFQAISPGQRIEVVCAMVASGFYVFLSRRACRRETAGSSTPGSVGVRPRTGLGVLAWAGLAAAGVFVLVGFLGAWPALFARLTLPAGAGAEQAFTRLFRMQGLVAEESRRLALVTVIPALAALILFLWRTDALRFTTWMRRLRWTRFAHYTGLSLAGVYLGSLVYGEYMPGVFRNPVDYVAAGVLWAALAAAYLAALAWNDLHDRDADRINDPHSPLVNGRLTEGAVSATGTVSAFVALFLALCVGYAPFLLMIVCLFLAWVYSAPPLRLKRWPIVATLALAVLSLLSAAIGFSLFAQEMTPLVFPRRIACLLLLGITLGFCAKDIKDAQGDRETGVVTLATLMRERPARVVAAALVAAAYLQVLAFLPLGALFAGVVVASATAGAIVTLRARRPDRLLLAAFVVFSLLMLLFLSRHPGPLRERVPADLRELHGETRDIEERIREARLLGREKLEDPLGEWIEKALALIPAVEAESPPERGVTPWRERLYWARAQIAEPRAAGEDLALLTGQRPLRAAYWDARIAAASRAGDAAAARDACTRALALGVRPGDALRNRAALALAEGASRPAGEARASVIPDPARDLAGAFLCGQREALCWVLLGDLLQQRGDAQSARQAYEQAVARDPETPEAWSGLGSAAHAAGELAAAEWAFARALALTPQDPWVLNNLGVVLRDRNRLDEALARFRAAQALAPQLFEPVYNLGITYAMQGRTAEALQWLAQAQAMRPRFAPVEDALDRLKSNPRSTPRPRQTHTTGRTGRHASRALRATATRRGPATA